MHDTPRWRGGGWFDCLICLGVGISGGCNHRVHQHPVSGQDLGVNNVELQGTFGDLKGTSMDLGDFFYGFGGTSMGK